MPHFLLGLSLVSLPAFKVLQAIFRTEVLLLAGWVKEVIVRRSHVSGNGDFVHSSSKC
jgi:hypothetical protein